MTTSSTPSTSSPAWLPGVYGALIAMLMIHLVMQVSGRDGFSWMDPYQYYTYATAIAQGSEGALDYPIASSYPLMLGQALKIKSGIPMALAVNAGWLLVLAVGILGICRRLSIPGLAPAVLLAVMAAPVVYGLSRELYLEFPLAAVASVHFALWLYRDRIRPWKFWSLFGLVFLIGFSMKLTYPIFLAGPVGLEAIRLFRSKSWRQLVGLVASVTVPVVAALAVTLMVSPRGFGYILTQGNTVIPPMRLIGPADTFSVAALLFYPESLMKQALLLLSPIALLVIWQALPPRGESRAATSSSLDLWLALAVPLVVFTLIPIREPRHLLPVIVPLIILTFYGASQLRHAQLRIIVLGILTGLAGVQYGLAATKTVYVPYLIDQPMHKNHVLQAMFQATPDRESYLAVNGLPDADRWRFTRNTVLSGFDPNEALSLIWSLAPGVAVNLDVLPDGNHPVSDIGYQVYMDLFMLNAFNSYNHRCGWPGIYETFSREEAIAHADTMILKKSETDSVPAIPGFLTVARLPVAAGQVIYLLLAETPPDLTLRALYAKRFLERQPETRPFMLNAVYQDLLLESFLRRDLNAMERAATWFPDSYQPGGITHKIYYFPVYTALLARLQASASAAEPPPREP